MSWDELTAKAYIVEQNPDGTQHAHWDAAWQADMNTREDNYDALLYQYGSIY